MKNITPDQKDGIEAILKGHSMKLANEYDDNYRISMACPAMPLCGLAVTEAERFMPPVVERMDALFAKHEVSTPTTMRMTGYPNGCKRPYMAELGFVGSGPNMYQLWLGRAPNQTRLAFTYTKKVKKSDFEKVLSPLLTMYTSKRRKGEAFGDFCARMGKEELLAYSEDSIGAATAVKSAVVEAPMKAAPAKKALAVVKSVGEPAPAFEVKLSSRPKAKVSVARGPPKITVLDSNGKEEPPVVEIDITGPMTQTEDGSKNESSSASPLAKQKKAMAKNGTKPRPRLVSDEIMARLKNIAALRDMSASNLADEIISTYLAGVEDEEVGMDI